MTRSSRLLRNVAWLSLLALAELSRTERANLIDAIEELISDLKAS